LDRACREMHKGQVGGAGLFATCSTVAVDQSGWRYRGGVLDVFTCATSGGHCSFDNWRSSGMMLYESYPTIEVGDFYTPGRSCHRFAWWCDWFIWSTLMSLQLFVWQVVVHREVLVLSLGMIK
jgi:hypothetical protein